MKDKRFFILRILFLELTQLLDSLSEGVMELLTRNREVVTAPLLRSILLILYSNIPRGIYSSLSERFSKLRDRKVLES